VCSFAAAATDLVIATTMTHTEEASGITLAAQAAGLPVVISFTVEADGRLPTGQPVGDAIETLDAATGSYPAYYMVNCAHSTHFRHLFADTHAWTERLGGIRANASTMSHTKIDEAETLDSGDPIELAERYEGAAPGPPVPAGAGRLLRHRPPAHRRHQQAVRQHAR